MNYLCDENQMEHQIDTESMVDTVSGTSLSSNTVLRNSNPLFVELNKGIDSLYMSYRGILKDGLLTELEDKKKYAQSENMDTQLLAIKSIGEHNFKVSNKGRGKYSYVLHDNWFDIQISDANTIPRLYVQISSELLNIVGIQYAIDDLRKVVSELLAEITSETVSQAHIFVDFTTDSNIRTIKRESWVSRASEAVGRWDELEMSGWSIGKKGSPIMANLYDKTLEIEKTYKLFFKDIWRERSWQENQQVWRLEFQLHRQYLKEMSVHTIDDLKDIWNDLWRYCTQDWLRLSKVDDTKRRDRRETEPLWTAIQNVEFGDGSTTGIVREVRRSRIPCDEVLFVKGLGYLISYAAREGHYRLEDALVPFLRDAKIYHMKKDKSANQINASNDYIKTKLKMRKRDFNLLREEESRTTE